VRVLFRAKPVSKGPPSPKPSTGSRRGSTDLVRLYLQDIGRVDLLSHEEELTLARQVQRRERLLRERRRLAATHPALQELTNSAWLRSWATGPLCSSGLNSSGAR
jgi:hypothetical protein